MMFLKKTRSNSTEERTRFRALKGRWWVGAAIVCLLVVGGFIFSAKSGQKAQRVAQQGPANAPGVPVVATAVKKSDFSVYLSGLGAVTPLNTVTVKSRVDGELTKILFREGQVVSKGELLAEIDARPFDVQLTQAQGAMARDQAQLENAKA